MRIFWGLVSMVLSLGLTWMIQTGRLQSTHPVPGLEGKSWADLDPRKLISSYKGSITDAQLRVNNLMDGKFAENRADGQLQELQKDINAVSGTDANKTSGEPAKKPTAPTRALSPSGARPDQIVYRYSMDIVRASEKVLPSFLGEWISFPPDPAHLLSLKISAPGSISKMSLRHGNLQKSYADSHGLVWIEAETRQNLIPITDYAYLHIERIQNADEPLLKATVFQQGNVGTTFHPSATFELHITGDAQN